MCSTLRPHTTQTQAPSAAPSTTPTSAPSTTPTNGVVFFLLPALDAVCHVHIDRMKPIVPTVDGEYFMNGPFQPVLDNTVGTFDIIDRYTIELDLQVNVAATTNYGAIFNIGDSEVNTRLPSLWIAPNSAKLHLSYMDTIPSAILGYISDFTLTLGQVYHIRIDTFMEANVFSYFLYIDGSLDGSQVGIANPAFRTELALALTGVAIKIAHNPIAATVMNGVIQNFRIFELSPSLLSLCALA